MKRLIWKRDRFVKNYPKSKRDIKKDQLQSDEVRSVTKFGKNFLMVIRKYGYGGFSCKKILGTCNSNI